MLRDLFLLLFLENPRMSPWCSMHVANPDRIWAEPWRFLMYGFVHNSKDHLTVNAISQLFVGLPLELSHSSWRVALVYLLGIVFGGFGRQVLTNPEVPLAGASGRIP